MYHCHLRLYCVGRRQELFAPLREASLPEHFTHTFLESEEPDAALAAQGVTAQESLYVDDYKPEADGAREQGFTSFLMDRGGTESGEWVIHNLKELIDFVEK